MATSKNFKAARVARARKATSVRHAGGNKTAPAAPNPQPRRSNRNAPSLRSVTPVDEDEDSQQPPRPNLGEIRARHQALQVQEK